MNYITTQIQLMIKSSDIHLTATSHRSFWFSWFLFYHFRIPKRWKNAAISPNKIELKSCSQSLSFSYILIGTLDKIKKTHVHNYEN